MNFLKLFFPGPGRFGMEDHALSYVSKKKSLKALKSWATPIFDLAFKIVAYPNYEGAHHWREDLDIYADRLRKNQLGYHGRPNYSAEGLWERIWEDSVVSYGLMTLEYYGPTHGSFDMRDVKKIIEGVITKITNQPAQ